MTSLANTKQRQWNNRPTLLRLDNELLEELREYAFSKRVPESHVVNEALSVYFRTRNRKSLRRQRRAR